MFTEEQILSALQKVKSGADYPGLVRELKDLGVQSYDHNVADGSNSYYGADGKRLRIAHKQARIAIARKSSAAKLKNALRIHQKGETDYPTFCKQAAEAGVEKWVSNLVKMTVTYLDHSGHRLVEEKIPEPEPVKTTAQIAKHVRDAYNGGNWTVSNMKELLMDVTWEEANKKVGDLNTIAALVFHIHYFFRIQTKVLSGGPLTGSDADSFKPLPIESEKQWRDFLELMMKEVNECASLVEQLSDSMLGRSFTDPKYGTYFRNLVGNIEHLHYHMGQIAVIKKLIRGKIYK